jgi:hypothetical protein
MVTANTQEPKSSHEAKIHETARVGLALTKQAIDVLILESKFDVKPRNQKAFLCKLSKRAMDCSWELHVILTFVVKGVSMGLFEDHGKIPMATIKLAAVTARAANTTATKKNWTQRVKHLSKCLSKLIMTKVHDSINPYLKSVNQDGPMYFKYIMMEVASNPSPEAEARKI